MRLLFFFCAALVFTSVSYGQEAKPKNKQVKDYYLPEGYSEFVCKDCKESKISTEEIGIVKQIMAKAVKEYNIKAEKQYYLDVKEYQNEKIEKSSYVIDLKRYKFQIVAGINKSKEKIVLIFCHCYESKFFDYTKQLVSTQDGGNCYFQLKINLTTKKYYDFFVNGIA